MAKKIPSIKELRKQLQSIKRRENLTWVGRICNFLSIYVTRVLILTPITANQVTFLMFLSGLLSGIFFATGKYVYVLVGLLFFHLYGILDWSDGEVARYRGIFSPKGGYADYMIHIIVNPLIIMGMALGGFFNNPLPIPNYVFLIAGFSGAFFYMINHFDRLKKYEMYIDKGQIKVLLKLQKRYKNLKDNSLKKKLSTFFRLQEFGAVLFFGVFNLLPYLVLIYSVVLPIMALSRLYLEYQKTETEVKPGDLDNKY